MIDLYDEELPVIGKVAHKLNRIWRDEAHRIDITNLKKTSQILNNYHKRCIDEFLDVGFIVEVDVTQIYGDKPPIISIVERVIYEPLDFDKRAWEVRKAKERNESFYGEDKGGEIIV